jgi:hypothetical protein
VPSPPNITNIPPPRAPLIDDRTGLMSREWYRFLLNLFTLTGGGSNSISLQDVQLGPPGADEAAFQTALQAYADLTPAVAPATADALFDAAAQLAPPAGQAAPSAFDMLDPPAFLDVPGRFLLPTGVTPGASPYIYQNTSGRPGDMLVSGGMVTAIAFSRDNATFYSVGIVSGVFPLSAYDFLRVTYTVAPTMTFIPR